MHNYKTPLSADWQQPCHRLRMLTKLLILQDEVVTRIEERISAWTFLPPGNWKCFKLLNPVRLGFSSFQLSIMVLLWLLQKMVSPSKYYITRTVRSMSHTLTTSMTKKIKSLGAIVLLLCSCTCLMLRRVERPSSPMQR
jgi:hypothetical protein